MIMISYIAHTIMIVLWSVAVAYGQSIDEDRVSRRLAWDPPTELTDGSPLPGTPTYELRWQMQGAMTWAETSVTEPTAIATNLLLGETYIFEVRAMLGEQSSEPARLVAQVQDGDTTAPGGRVVHLPFERGLRGAMANYGSGPDAVFHGVVTVPGAAPRPGSAARLDGVDDWVDLGTLGFPVEGFTFTAWFHADDLSLPRPDARIASMATGTAAGAHIFMLSPISSDGIAFHLRARLRVAGITHTFVADGLVIVSQRWHHAAITHDGQVLRVYLDGIISNEWPLPGIADNDPTMIFAIGAQPPGAGDATGDRRYWRGMIDDVRLYNEVLDASQIRAIMVDAVPQEALIISQE